MSVEDLSETLLQIKVRTSFAAPETRRDSRPPNGFVWCPPAGFQDAAGEPGGSLFSLH